MLAEIFMVRLEATARVAQETIPASNSRFIPFYPAGLVEQKIREPNPDAMKPVSADKPRPTNEICD
jgi:hypothetical protein